MKTKLLVLIGSLSALSLALPGCGDDDADDDTTGGTSGASGSTSKGGGTGKGGAGKGGAGKGGAGKGGTNGGGGEPSGGGGEPSGGGGEPSGGGGEPSGGGGEPGAGGGGGGDDKATMCAAYCTAFIANCETHEANEYTDEDDCVTTCNGSDWEVGVDAITMEDTVGCRKWHAEAADDDIHCYHSAEVASMGGCQ